MKYEGLEEYAKEHSIKECAQEYNVSYSAIASYLSRYRILHKSDCRIQGITKTATQRASEIGITRQGLLYRLKVYSVETAFHKIKRR